MGKFNSDDHYIYDCGQESLRRNGVALITNKRWRRIYSQQKQDRELTVAQIMNSLLQNSDLN